MINSGALTVVFPGTFDPFTKGHKDIVSRALKIFEKVFIAVVEGDNGVKTSLFSPQERVALIKSEFAGIKQVIVESFDGLLVEYVKSKGAKLVIRGLRATTDYEYEAQMALTNRHLSDSNIETLFLITKEEYSYISSSVVKQVAKFGGDVSKLVGAEVNQALIKKFRN